MVCPRCGQIINDDARYCEGCGENLTNSQSRFQLIQEESPQKDNTGFGILVGFIIILIAVIVIYSTFSDSGSPIPEDEHITYVKNGSPTSYPDITYDEAFSNFFANRTWKYFKSDDGKDVVEFNGDCTYHDVDVTATIQFVLDMDEGTFELSYLAFNDVPQSLLIEYALITKVFESY